jgi:uncharacterized membrane protein YraQ (UPF0718 family)
MIIAIIAGIFTNIFKEEELPKPKFFKTLKKEEKQNCCLSIKDESKIRKIIRYAYVTLLGDIAKALFWGLIIGALITTFIPSDLSGLLKGNSWISYIIVLIIALPMYVCATASLPIAASLMLSGVSAGAAFVFLSAGPATNTVTIGVVKKMLGTRVLYIYLSVISIGSILFGLGLDMIFDSTNIDAKSIINIGEKVGIVDQISSIILWSFLIYFLIKPIFNKKHNNGHH